MGSTYLRQPAAPTTCHRRVSPRYSGAHFGFRTRSFAPCGLAATRHYRARFAHDMLPFTFALPVLPRPAFYVLVLVIPYLPASPRCIPAARSLRLTTTIRYRFAIRRLIPSSHAHTVALDSVFRRIYRHLFMVCVGSSRLPVAI